MYIKTIDEIIDLFPSVTGDSDGELHSGCPFCKEGRKTIKHGITFYGDDRLIWFADRKGVSCRQCGTYASMTKLLELLLPGSVIATDFVTESSTIVEAQKKPLDECLTTQRYVEKLHQAVDRDYWKKFLWTDATIDRFQLGYGQLYEYGSWKQPRHIIPFVPRNAEKALDGFMLEGRLNKRSDATDFERYNVKTQGSVKGHFWLIKDSSSDEIAIAEGPKDAITAWQLGYKNVMAIFGTSLWRPNFAAWISDEGYAKATIFGDNDDAGRKFIDIVTHDLHVAGVTPYRINWPDDVAQGFDLTDALITFGLDGISAFLSKNIHHAKSGRGWISNIQTFQPDYQPPTTEHVLPLQQVRTDMPVVLNDYIQNYKDKTKSAGRGVVKVLAAPPGSGKSHALVRLAQQEAQRIIERREEFQQHYNQTRSDLMAELEETTDQEERSALVAQIERLDAKWGNYSTAKVLFASPFINAWDDIQSQPGFDESLWFNFESRNSETCQNLPTAQAIGEKGYSVMKFCETTCPFAQDCAIRVRGYLLQQKLLRSRPITFVRHANLVSREMVKQYEVILIDENFLPIFSDFVTIEKMLPASRTWRDYLTVSEEETADAIEDLAKAVDAVNQLQEELSGRDCLLALEKALGRSLVDLVKDLDPDVVERFQPHAAPQSSDIKDLPPCVFPAFYRALVDEIDDFASGQYYNSRIHLVRTYATTYRMRVSTLFPIELPRSKKIIVADGTAMPELYGLMFDREVELYQPDIYNPSAKIVQLTGTDLPRNGLLRQLGSQVYKQLGKAEPEPSEVFDIFGQPVDTGKVQYSEEIYGAQIITDVLTMLRSVALDPTHEHVLFVTYKNLRSALEERVKQLAETDLDYAKLVKKVAFGHYGGLRGTNRYKDFDTVLLAGCPRQPYNELWRVIQAWARLKHYGKFIPNQLGYKPAAYHGVGMYHGYSYITFEDEFAQAFVEMVEAGEIRQCLDRIRIYAGGEKTAYLYMARPAAKWVTEVTSSRKAVRKAVDAKYEEVLAFVNEIYQEFKAFPKYGAVASKFSLSKYKAKQYVEDAKKALNPVSA